MASRWSSSSVQFTLQSPPWDQAGASLAQTMLFPASLPHPFLPPWLPPTPPLRALPPKMTCARILMSGSDSRKRVLMQGEKSTNIYWVPIICQTLNNCYLTIALWAGKHQPHFKEKEMNIDEHIQLCDNALQLLKIILTKVCGNI